MTRITAETSPANMAATVINQAARSAFLDDIARRFWVWFVEHEGDVLIERRVLFFTLRVRLRDLRWLFARIFGAPPEHGWPDVPAPGGVAA